MSGARGLSDSKAYPWQSFIHDRSEVHAEPDVRQYCWLSLRRFHILVYKLSRVDVILFTVSELSAFTLQRKIDLCENILEVYNAMYPGEATHRMNAMFELNCAKIVQTKRKLEQNLIKRPEAIVTKFPFVSLALLI